jgi:hypothetical protein
MMQLAKEQEILMNVADMIIQVYTVESLQLRVEKLVAKRGEAACTVQLDMMRLMIYDAADRINKFGKDALNSFAEGDELRMMQMGLRRFTKVDAVNARDLRRNIAEKLITENKYCF